MKAFFFLKLLSFRSSSSSRYEGALMLLDCRAGQSYALELMSFLRLARRLKSNSVCTQQGAYANCWPGTAVDRNHSARFQELAPLRPQACAFLL